MPKSLIFIADISGFTQFVNETDLTHSRHIISELLEALIEKNELDMSVAEIEGDAVLFYKYQQLPSVEELIRQCQSMFLEFHGHLLNYQHRRICNCGACSTAQDLTLKFIVHGGDFNFLKVKEHRKPHGPDVVLAHRLLKNNVPEKDYILITDGVPSETDGALLQEVFPWAKIKSGFDVFDQIGEVHYRFIPINELQKQVEVKPSIYPELTRDPIVIEGEVGLERAKLFEMITNFDFRDQWNNAPLSMEYEPEKVNRVGTRHVCVFKNENLEFETVSNDFGPDKLVYGERLRNYQFVSEATNYFILEDMGDRTKLRIESHIKPKNSLVKIFSVFYRAIFRKNLKKVFTNINAAAARFKLRREGSIHHLKNPSSSSLSTVDVS